MKKFAIVAAAAVLAACGKQQETTADQVRAALPAKDVIQISQPDPGSTDLTPSAAEVKLAEGGPTRDGKASLGVVSYLFAASVNGGVWSTLFQLEVVTLFPPTTTQGDAVTWGPYPDADGLNTWQLTASPREDGGYDYALQAAPLPGGTAFVDVISGVAYRGADRWHGHGSFDVDFDAVAAGTSHAQGWTQTDFGALHVEYDNRAARTLSAEFTHSRNADDPGADPANPNRVNAQYQFASTGGAGGDLQVAFTTVGPYSADNLAKRAGLNTRWVAGGAGRGDYQYSTDSGSFHESQCWAGAAARYAMTYDDLATSPYGAEADCDASLRSAEWATLTPPAT